ncbi:MAG: hypothetical protein ACI9OD_000694 [Limisphaerales bacterium]|jgi:hypothetical protein
MNPTNHWKKLAAWGCRGAPTPTDATAPCGFASRVAARWARGDIQTVPNLWEHFSLRSVAVATVIMLTTISLNYDLLTEGITPDVGITDAIETPLL